MIKSLKGITLTLNTGKLDGQLKQVTQAIVETPDEARATAVAEAIQALGPLARSAVIAMATPLVPGLERALAEAAQAERERIIGLSFGDFRSATETITPNRTALECRAFLEEFSHGVASTV